MEKYGIARSQTRRLGGTEYGGIIRGIGTKELRVVEPIGVKRCLVGARYEPERAVVDGFVAERKPHRDEILAFERPVANVAMPARQASVKRMLGHEAVVMGAGQQDRFAEVRFHPSAHTRRCCDLGELRIAAVRVEEPPHRTRSGLCMSRAGVGWLSSARR